jgi:hypothetical protein
VLAPVAKLNARAGAPSRTAVSTIEALLFELRPGLSGLSESGPRARLAACDEAAMQTIVAALSARKARNNSWLPAWTAGLPLVSRVGIHFD